MCSSSGRSACSRCSATGSAEASASVIFTIEQTGERIEVFTTRPTPCGVSPSSSSRSIIPRSSGWQLGGTWEVEPMIGRARRASMTDRAGGRRHEEGAFLGVHAVNPVNDERVPVFAAPYVLMEYGTGAIMAVPAHDERDFAFARSFAAGSGGDPTGGRRPGRPRHHDGGDAARRRHGRQQPFDGAVPGVDREGDRLARAGRPGEAAVHFRLGTGWSRGSGSGGSDPDRALSVVRRGGRARRRAAGAASEADLRLGGESPLAPPDVEARRLPELRRRGDARHRHDGHVRRLELVPVPLLLAGL